MQTREKKKARDSQITVFLTVYDQLRQEIRDSIKLQFRAFLVVGVFLAIVFGLGMGLTETTFRLLVVGMPPVAVALLGIWLIEQSRMMRAGDYLQFLEDKINRQVGRCCISWENWLRRDCIPWLDIHKIHHISQYLIISLFLGLSGISICGMWEFKILSPSSLAMFIVFFCIMMFIFFCFAIKVIKHEGRSDLIKNWEKNYWAKLKKRGDI